MHTGFWWGDLREGDHFEDACIGAWMILRWIFRKKYVGHGLDQSGSV
jgi:hypothetical protein